MYCGDLLQLGSSLIGERNHFCSLAYVKTTTLDFRSNSQHVQTPSAAVCLWIFLYPFLWDQVTHLVSFFPRNSWFAFAVRFGSFYICIVKQRLISFPAFGWIWAKSIPLYTSEILLPLLSAVTLLIDTSDSFWLAAITFLPVELNCVGPFGGFSGKGLFGLPVNVTSGLDLVVNPL